MNPFPAPRLARALLLSVWGLAAVALLSLLLTRELGWTVSGLILAALPVLFYFESERRGEKIPWIENLLILLLFAGALAVFFKTRASFLIVVADFLSGFILLKLAFRKDAQDLMQIIALSFFILLSASTLALDFTYVFGLALYILGAAWTLALYSLARSEPGAGGDPAFREPDAAFRPLFRNCALTLALALAFTAGIFLFFPRFSAVVFKGSFLGAARESGISDRLDLAQSGPIFEDETLVLRLAVDPADREKLQRLRPSSERGSAASKSNWESGHLRGQSLAYFNGAQWLPRAPEEENKPAAGGGLFRFQSLSTNRFSVFALDKKILKERFGLKLDRDAYVDQTVYLESMDSPLLFGAPWMDVLNAKLPSLAVAADGSVARPRGSQGRIVYQVRSLAERPREGILRALAAEKNPDAESRAGLQLPALDFSKTRRLADSLVSARDNPYDKARKIEQYLRRNYRYSTRGEAGNRTDPVEEFLFQTRQGHCEYFAAALALMLRLEQVPARIATGFVLEEWNPSGNYFIVRSKDAHTWVEARIGGLWVDFDPTPRSGTGDLAGDGFIGRIGKRIDYLNFLWDTYVLSYDAESQRRAAQTVELKSNELSRRLDQTLSDWRARFRSSRWGHLWTRALPRFSPDRKAGLLKAPEPAGPAGKRTWPPQATRGLALALVAAALLFRKRLRALLTLSGDGKKTIINDFYKELLSRLSKFGWIKKPQETPREFLRRLEGETRQDRRFSPELREALESLTDDFYRARFSGRPATPEDIHRSGQSIRIVKSALK